MKFEQTVRAMLGEDYDTRFPARRGNQPDAEMTDEEWAFAARLLGLYDAAPSLTSAEKIRHSLIAALKSIRLGAEAREQRKLTLAARGGRSLYRYRVCAPDGTELLYPARGTIHTDKRHVLLQRMLPTDPAIARWYVERYYACHLNHARQTGNTEREERVLAAIERDVAEELAKDEARDHGWRVWQHSASYTRIENAMDQYLRGDFERTQPPRYSYDYAIATGTPFSIDA